MHVGIVGPCSSGPLADLLSDSAGVDLKSESHLITTIVRALVQRQHHVSVITLSSEIEEPITLTGPRLHYYVYPMRTSKRMRDVYRVERQGLKQGIHLAKPEVLHAHWTYEFALACLETGLPTVITAHDNAFQVLRFCKDLYRVGRLYLQIRVIRRARLLTAVSPYLANSLRWLARTKIELIPNPVEVSEKPQGKVDEDIHPVKIATVLNGWGRRKNPKAAIRAFALLRCHLPEAHMYMYGLDFEAGGVAARWAMSRGLARNIHFCGFLPHHELQKALSRMSLLLHPAREESFGMVLVEAIALGLPVIAGIASGGVPWVLDEGRAGFLTDVTDPEEIVQTLLTCIQNVNDRQQRQRTAYQRVMSLFSPDSVAAQYEAIYEKALSLH